MPRTPTEFAVHFLLEGGHREEVRFAKIQDFQKWYGSDLAMKFDSQELINVPLKTVEGEFMVVRPARIVAIRVEPVFSSSVERY